MGLKEDNVFYIKGPYLLTSKLIIEYYALIVYIHAITLHSYLKILSCNYICNELHS